jgi:hypothetical protein
VHPNIHEVESNNSQHKYEVTSRIHHEILVPKTILLKIVIKWSSFLKLENLLIDISSVKNVHLCKHHAPFEESMGVGRLRVLDQGN